MKTSELNGAQLDYWVGRANGWRLFRDTCWMNDNNEYQWQAGDFEDSFKPSTEWAQGGPIIERERIKLMPTIPTAESWYATKCSSGNLADMIVWRGKADTPLVAAMRCYVSEKVGDEVPDA